LYLEEKEQDEENKFSRQVIKIFKDLTLTRLKHDGIKIFRLEDIGMIK